MGLIEYFVDVVADYKGDFVVFPELDNTFSTIEAHGSYSTVTESAVNSKSSIKELKVVLDTEDYTAIEIMNINGTTRLFITANTNASKEATHILTINNKNYTWIGSYDYN